MTKVYEVQDLLIEKCQEDYDLFSLVIADYVEALNENELNELEDFLVNNFGDD